MGQYRYRAKWKKIERGSGIGVEKQEELDPELLIASDNTSNDDTDQNDGIKVEFSNERSSPVELFWLRPSDGKEMNFGTLQPHSRMPMNTFEGHTWIMRDADTHQEVKRAVASVGQGQAIAIE